MIPLQHNFVLELLFWLAAGHFLSAYVFPAMGSVREAAVGNAFANAVWVLLATGRVELGFAELFCFMMVDWIPGLFKPHSTAWHAAHLTHKLLWFICVVWLWPTR